MSKAQAMDRAVELMERVGIPRARDRLRSYPHEFSGGMRQRVMIAMALSCSPRLLIADEPTTALDVTIQAQILDELRQLRSETGAGIILVTHDLGVVADIADRIVVMYAGPGDRAGDARRDLLRPPAPVHVGAARLDRAARPRPLARGCRRSRECRRRCWRRPRAATSARAARTRSTAAPRSRARGPAARGARAPGPLLAGARAQALAAPGRAIRSGCAARRP